VKRSVSADGEVCDRLCEDILSGQFPPGSRLTVAGLAERYRVGTMPIRAALQELRGRGLITVEPNRGARVRRVDADFINNIYDLRQAVWGIIIPRCVRFITNADIEELEAIQDRMEAATAAGDFAEARRQNRQFHHLMYETGRNPEAADVLEQNWVLINGFRAIFGYGPGRLEGTNAMHRALIEAFRARDGAKALELVRASAERSREDLVRLISEQKIPPRQGSRGTAAQGRAPRGTPPPSGAGLS
jgi:DNA-binding GntR family transcriptional regulator